MMLSELQRICLSWSLAFIRTIHDIPAAVKLFGSNYRNGSVNSIDTSWANNYTDNLIQV